MVASEPHRGPAFGQVATHKPRFAYMLLVSNLCSALPVGSQDHGHTRRRRRKAC